MEQQIKQMILKTARKTGVQSEEKTIKLTGPVGLQSGTLPLSNVVPLQDLLTW